MKKAAVATTTASGAAVSSSRITAVQSVYMALRKIRPHHPLRRSPLGAPLLALAMLFALPAAQLPAVHAGVVFENCSTGPDGSYSCDTRPTGNTLMDDEAARYGLFDQASPGWAEYNPYEGYDQMLGGGSW
jgi:hypothetical protein